MPGLKSPASQPRGFLHKQKPELLNTGQDGGAERRSEVTRASYPAQAGAPRPLPTPHCPQLICLKPEREQETGLVLACVCVLSYPSFIEMEVTRQPSHMFTVHSDVGFIML